MKVQPRPLSAGKVGPVRAAILAWFGLDYVSTGGDTASSDAGVVVTADSAMQISAVWSCVRLIAETIATLPLSIYERTRDGKRVARDHPLQFIVHDQPNDETSASVFWEAMVAAMLLRGCGRAERLMLGPRLVGLRFLSPARLSITRGVNGYKEYRYTEEGGRQRIIPADRIWAVPGFSLDGKNGVSVISYAANVFGAALAADQAAATTFERGLLPRVWFKFPKILTKQQRDDARDLIQNRLSGAVNAGKPAILEADMEVGTLGIPPKDAQLLESREWSVEEICRWFRVPPHMVGHTGKSTSWGTGIEQQMIGFLTFTLAPWLKRIEQAIVKDLMTPADRSRFYAKFVVEGLLRADSAGRAGFYASMVNNGILTRDEVRELEDREPLGGNAAVLTVQTSMAPLDTLGQADTADQQARAALRAWLQDITEPEEITP
jgi:HK97 family phage portal protein